MKYLKLFLEHNEIPSHFIDLYSIGYVLDPNTGIMYAKWKKAFPSANILDRGYDQVVYSAENGYELDFDGTIPGVSPEEELELSKWWKSCEEMVGDKINWDMINVAKDLSLDYLDEGLDLNIQVLASITPTAGKIQVYYEGFSHNSSTQKWYKYFPEKMKIVTDGVLQYRFSLRETKSGNPTSRCELYNYELSQKLSEIYKSELIIKP
jgi:hypothetical protein